jgi:hypothetical protein
MARGRGRPRKESIEQVLNAATPALNVDVIGYSSSDTPDMKNEKYVKVEENNIPGRFPKEMQMPNRGPTVIISPDKVVPTPARFAHVRELLAPYVMSHGLKLLEDDCSITVFKGRVAECLNVTERDKEWRKLINRVLQNSAVADHAIGR